MAHGAGVTNGRERPSLAYGRAGGHQHRISRRPVQSTRQIVALCDQPEVRSRLQTALDGYYDLRLFSFGDALSEVLPTLPRVIAYVLEAASIGRGAAHLVTALRRENPQATIIVYARLTPHSAKELLAAGRAGAHDVIIFGYDDTPQSIRDIMSVAQRRSELTEIATRVATAVSDRARPFIYAMIRNVHVIRCVDDLAGILKTPRRTISYQLLRGGLPPLNDMMAWSRIIVALHWRETLRLAPERVAARLGLGSATALRSLVRRRLGCSLGEAERRYGVDGALSLFRRDLDP